MNIVIDTNIFISALIKDSLTRNILKEFNANFLFPEFGFQELIKHKAEIAEKSGFSEKEFYTLLLRLLKYVKIIPSDLIKDYCKEAQKVIGHIDLDDVQFIATALAFNCPIWSDDKHFLKQDIVKILGTKEMINLR